MAPPVHHPQWASLLLLVLFVGASIPTSHGRTVPFSAGAETVQRSLLQVTSASPVNGTCVSLAATPNQCFTANGSQSICCSGLCLSPPPTTPACGGPSPGTPAPTTAPAATTPAPTTSSPTGTPAPTTAAPTPGPTTPVTSASPVNGTCVSLPATPNQCFVADGSASICCSGLCQSPPPTGTPACGGQSPTTPAPTTPKPTTPAPTTPAPTTAAPGPTTPAPTTAAPTTPAPTASATPAPTTAPPTKTPAPTFTPGPSAPSVAPVDGACNPYGPFPNQCFNYPGNASVCCATGCPPNAPLGAPYCAAGVAAAGCNAYSSTPNQCFNSAGTSFVCCASGCPSPPGPVASCT